MSKAPQQRIDIVNIITNFSGKDNNIVIPRPFLVWCGGELAIALFLSECLYWSDKTTDPDGWFARTAEEWEASTTLARTAIDRAYVTLTTIGLRRSVKRSQWHDYVPVIHYRFDQNVLREAANLFFSEHTPLEIATTEQTRKVLADENKQRKLQKVKTGLSVTHDSESVSRTNGNLSVTHDSYKEIRREEIESKEKEFAPATQRVIDPSKYQTLDGSAKWPETDEVSTLRLEGETTTSDTPNAGPKSKTKTATTPPSKVPPKVPPADAHVRVSRLEWATNRTFAAPGLSGHLMAQMLGKATKGKRKEFNFETPVTVEEVYWFRDWWTHQFPALPLPTTAETLYERFAQMRGVPGIAQMIDAAKVMIEDAYQRDTCPPGETPVQKLTPWGTPIVPDEERASPESIAELKARLQQFRKSRS